MKVLLLYTGVLLHRHAVNDYFRSKRGMALVDLVLTICEMNPLTFYVICKVLQCENTWFYFPVGQAQKVLSAVDLKLIKSNPKKKKKIFIVHIIQRIKMEKKKLTHVTWAQEATFKTNK